MPDIRKALYLGTLLFVLCGSAALAQQQAAPSVTPSPPQTPQSTGTKPDDSSLNLDLGKANTLKEEEDNAVDRPANNDGYVDTTFKNIAKMYWAAAKFSIEDDSAIDSLVMIEDCDLFKRFYTNDFEWEQIRKAARQDLLLHMDRIPTHFQIVLPVYLGRYDQGKQSFEVLRESQQINTTRIAAMTNSNRNVCSKAGLSASQYPRNIILQLNRPFTFQELPVPLELAKMYVEYVRRKTEGKSFDAQRAQMHARGAFLRLKVKVIQYRDTIQPVSNSPPMAVITAKFDGWEVYADDRLTMPLFAHTFAANEVPKGTAPYKLQSTPPPAPKEYMPYKEKGSPAQKKANNSGRHGVVLDGDPNAPMQ